MKARTLIVAVAALATVATACGDDSDATSDAGTDCNNLPTVQEGVLTVATGETVFPPWMGAGEDDFDDPTTGTGYEGALVYALAAELGFDAGDVTFVRTGFDEVIAPGEKDWDFNIQQYSITPERDEPEGSFVRIKVDTDGYLKRADIEQINILFNGNEINFIDYFANVELVDLDGDGEAQEYPFHLEVEATPISFLEEPARPDRLDLRDPSPMVDQPPECEGL